MITIADFEQFTTKQLRFLLAEYLNDLEYAYAIEYRSRENLEEVILDMPEYRKKDFLEYCEVTCVFYR